MQLTTKALNELAPVAKLKRTILKGTNIYVEQRASGYSLLYKYQSPVLYKTRYMKLVRFTYDHNVTKEDIINIKNKKILLDADIVKDIDPLEVKQKGRLRATQKRIDKKLNINLDEAFKQYNETDDFKGLADSTQNAYLKTYAKHIKPVFGNKSVQSYTRGKIELFLDKKPAGTQHICLAIFKNLENWLLKTDTIVLHRLQKFTKKPAGKKRTSIDDKTLVELLASLDNNNSVHQAIHFQLLTGCRIGEVLNATWDEIDFKNNLWTIPWQHIKTERKATNSNRPHVLPITSSMLQVLLLQKQHGTSGLIFKSVIKNKKISIVTVNNILHPYNCTSHILRKTVSTNILSTLKLGSMEFKLIINHKVVKGVDVEYLDETEQFLDAKLITLQAWHKRLEELSNTMLHAKAKA